MFQTNNIHSLIFFSNTDKRKAETEAEDFEFFDTKDDIIRISSREGKFLRGERLPFWHYGK